MRIFLLSTHRGPLVLMLFLMMSDVFNTLQVQLGSLYINNFNLYNQVYQVQAQAEGWGRSNPQDIGRLFVRNSDNEMYLRCRQIDMQNHVHTKPTMPTHHNGGGQQA